MEIIKPKTKKKQNSSDDIKTEACYDVLDQVGKSKKRKKMFFKDI